MGSLFESDPQKTTNTDTMYQQDQYDKLLSGADSWLASGGMGNAPSYVSNMGGILGQMGQGFQDMVSGKGQGDRYQALQDLNAASSAQASNALSGTLSGIGLGASGTGTANSSRRGVAEGVATAAANRDLASLQAQQNQQFLTNEQAIKQQGLQGMSGLFGLTGQLHQLAQGDTAGAKQLQNLMAYQNLISGNMGGTNTSTVTGGGPSLGASILGGAAAGMGMGIDAGLIGKSDKDLKKKIKKIKNKKGKNAKTKDGIDLAEWEWNKKAEKEYGLSGKSKGVLAQEVEKVRPDAVMKDAKGYRSVNYGKLF